jgi:hypothetical protein
VEERLTSVIVSVDQSCADGSKDLGPKQFWAARFQVFSDAPARSHRRRSWRCGLECSVCALFQPGDVSAIPLRRKPGSCSVLGDQSLDLGFRTAAHRFTRAQTKQYREAVRVAIPPSGACELTAFKVFVLSAIARSASTMFFGDFGNERPSPGSING